MRSYALLGGVALPVLALAMAVPSMAQSVSSSIRGTVIDTEGFAVPNAAVEVRNEGTGQVKRMTTSAGGFFTATGLSVGDTYTVAVTAEGYKPSQVTDIRLTLGEPLRLDVAMVATETAGEEVTVVGIREASQAIDSRGVGAQYDAENINNLPTVTRDVKDVVAQSPFAYIDFGDTESPISIGGANPRCNSFLIDGLPQNDSFGLNRGGYPTARSPLPIDWSEQVQVAVTPYNVEYNDFCGGVINVVTKTGDNDFHGSAYYYYKDDSLRGSKSGDRRLTSVFEEKNYGATFSGPIIEDTLFFFVGYDKIEKATPVSVGPGEDSSESFAQAVPGVSQSDIQAIQDISNSLWGFDPLGLADGFTEENERWIAKVNWNITDQHRAQLSYQHAEGGTLSISTPTFSPSPGNAGVLKLASNWYLDAEELDAYTLQVFSDWTERLSTELRVGRVDVKGNQLPLNGNQFPEIWVRTDGADDIQQAPGEASDDGYVVFGPDFSRHYNYMDYTLDQIKLTATYDMDEHVISGGYEVKMLDVYNAFVQGARGTYRFDSIEDFQNGILGSGIDNRGVTPAFWSIQYNNAVTNDPDDAAAFWGYDLHSVYIQDDWDVTEQFSVMIGLRYDWFTSDGDILLNQGFLDTYGFANTGDLDGESVLLPRFSFAYDFEIPEDQDLQLSVRGGVGRFSGGSPNVWISNNYSNTGVITAGIQGFPGGPIASGSSILFPAADFLNFNPFPVPQPLQDGLTTRAGGGVVNALSPDFQMPSTWRFNIGLDGSYEGYNFTVEFLHTVGKDQLFWRDLRQTVDPNLLAPDADLGRVRYVTTFGRPSGTGSSFRDIVLENRDAGEATYIIFAAQKEWEFDEGAGTFNLSLGYTWSDVEDIGGGTSSVANSNLTNRSYTNLNDPEEATSDFERKHRATLNANLAYQFFEGYETRFNLFATRMSGQPFSYVFASGATGAFGTNQQNNANLFYVPQTDASGNVTATSDPRIVYSSTTTEANFAAFNDYLEATGLIDYAGMIAPRNAFRGPWSTRVDFGIEQDVTLYEDYSVTLEFDIFNLGNLLNNDWGRFTSVTFPPAASVINSTIVNNGASGCTNPTNCYLYSISSLPLPGSREAVSDASYWQIQFGIRFQF